MYSSHFPLPIFIYIFLYVIGGCTITSTLSVYTPFLFSVTCIVGAAGVSTSLLLPPPGFPLSLLPLWPPPPVVPEPPVPPEPPPCQLPCSSPARLIYTLSYPQLVFSLILFPSVSYILSTLFALAYIMVLSPTSNSPLYVCHDPFPTLYSFVTAFASYMIFTFVVPPAST